MEPETRDHSTAFRNLHSSSGEMKLRKRKSTQYVIAQEKRSRRRGECGAHRRAQGTWHLGLHRMVEKSSGSLDSIIAVLCKLCLDLPQSSCRT